MRTRPGNLVTKAREKTARSITMDDKNLEQIRQLLLKMKIDLQQQEKIFKENDKVNRAWAILRDCNKG